jgi:hypothetical protein
MIRRVWCWLGPLGRGARALVRGLRPRHPSVAPASPIERPRVSCVLQVQGDVDGLVAKCRSVLRQQWRPIEVVHLAQQSAI